MKRKEVHSPLFRMVKAEVCEQKMVDCVVMPQTVDQSFKQWWDAISLDEEVDVRIPHAEHGLSRRTSNQAKTSVPNVSASAVHNCD